MRAMVDRYKQAFSAAKHRGTHAFIPFTVLGWPSPDHCLSTIQAMIDEGATALELGIAFSDPVADGPVIQRAGFETLESGFTVPDAFALLKRVRALNAEIPIGLLVYFNLVLAAGIDKFYRQAAEAGVDSVLIADLPPDEAAEVTASTSRHGISPVFIASPLTSDARLQKIADQSSAYIYVVSRLGITGSHETHDSQLQDLLLRARNCTELPLCVGFGVSSPKSARSMINSGADGVITGSKIVETVRADSAPEYPTLRKFLREMAAAVHSQTHNIHA